MSLGQPQYAVRSAHFHPTDDFRLLVVNDHDEIRLWQHEEETLIPGMRLVEGVRMAGFSKKGREVVAHGTDGFIKTWRVDALPLQQEQVRHGNKINHLVAQPVGKHGEHVASSSDDGDVRLWDVRSGLCVRILSKHVGGAHTRLL